MNEVRKVPVVYNDRGEEKITISVNVKRKTAEEIEAQAKRTGASKSKIASDALEKGLNHE